MSKTLVYQVDDVVVELQKSKPPKLVVTARGMAATGGWSKPELARHIYVMPPADGIQGFSFVAEPPPDGAVVTQVLTPISATAEISDPPSWVRGARVHATSNSQEALIGSASSILAAVETPGAADSAVKPVNLKIAVAKNDLVISWSIFIEGQQFFPPQFQFTGKFWVMALPMFPVTAPLDVILMATGHDNGVQRGRAAARIEANGTVLAPDLFVETIKNHGIDRRSYDV